MDTIRQRKAVLVKDLKKSDSPVRSNFVIPDSYRKWVWGCKKLIRFWARVQRDRIYSPALVESLSTLAGYWISIGTTQYSSTPNPLDREARASNNTELLAALRDIRDFDLKSVFKDQYVSLQELRVRTNSDCSLCGTELVWPAYITAKSFTGRTSRISKEFGVKCLDSHLKRLNSFISELVEEYPKLTKAVRDTRPARELVTAA